PAAASPELTAGTNNYAVVATPSSGQLLCDARTAATCPKVYGKQFLSLYASGSGGVTSDWYLAEIDASNVGKKLQVDLFDPGEGATAVGLLMPTGTNTWTPVSFTWSTDDGRSGGPTTSLPLTPAGTFDGDLLTLK